MKKTIGLLLLMACIQGLTAQQKVYNITAFGAVPDSTTHNTRFIQQAIDRAAAAGGGRYWCLPENLLPVCCI